MIQALVDVFFPYFFGSILKYFKWVQRRTTAPGSFQRSMALPRECACLRWAGLWANWIKEIPPTLTYSDLKSVDCNAGLWLRAETCPKPRTAKTSFVIGETVFCKRIQGRYCTVVLDSSVLRVPACPCNVLWSLLDELGLLHSTGNEQSLIQYSCWISYVSCNAHLKIKCNI